MIGAVDIDLILFSDFVISFKTGKIVKIIDIFAKKLRVLNEFFTRRATKNARMKFCPSDFSLSASCQRSAKTTTFSLTMSRGDSLLSLLVAHAGHAVIFSTSNSINTGIDLRNHCNNRRDDVRRNRQQNRSRRRHGQPGCSSVGVAFPNRNVGRSAFHPRESKARSHFGIFGRSIRKWAFL